MTAAGADTVAEPVLSVRRLAIVFETPAGTVRALDDVSFEVPAGATLALAGESGCGKTITALSILRLLPEDTATITGEALFSGQDLLKLDEHRMLGIRGSKIAMIFQEPSEALVATTPVGRQVADLVRQHRRVGRRAAYERTLELFEQVGMPSPRQSVRAYPHQLSSGMRQRTMIAMALACDPSLLIADDPTRALDGLGRAHVLDLLRQVQEERGMGILLISSDLGAVADYATDVVVLHDGRVIERGSVGRIFEKPEDERTRRLVLFDHEPPPPPKLQPSPPPLVQLRKLSKLYALRGPAWSRTRLVRALDRVTLSVHAGEAVGIVGESGSGKTTLGQTLLRLLEPSYGRILFEGKDVTHLSRRALHPFRRRIQGLVEDPHTSLNPRLDVASHLADAFGIQDLRSSEAANLDRVEQLLQRIGLSRDVLERFPHELCTGERQRVAMARLLLAEPRLAVLDEPMSALDAPARIRILTMLREQQDDYRLGYLLISNDLGIIESSTHRVGVMYLGRIVEIAPTASLYARRLHPYTRALLSAPSLHPRGRRLRIVLEGRTPDPADPPRGCAFHPRCPRFLPGTCDQEIPSLREIEPGTGHRVACHDPHV